MHSTLFSNRTNIRPAMLSRLAADEAEALVSFFRRPLPESVAERGAQLCELGLSEQTLLQMGHISRQFILEHLENDLISTAFQTVEAYQIALLDSFIKSREKIILGEQERIRSALQTTLMRYTNQMELAAGMAWAANSILDLNLLLNKAVELIRGLHSLCYVGIFILEGDNNQVFLRASAAAAEAEQEKLPEGYQLEVGDKSLVGQCMTDGKPRIALDVKAWPFQAGCLPSTHSAIAIPS